MESDHINKTLFIMRVRDYVLSNTKTQIELKTESFSRVKFGDIHMRFLQYV